MTEFDVYELRITTDEEFDIPVVWFNFQMHVNSLSKRLDYLTHATPFDVRMAILNQELVKWKGSRHKVGKISFPDAEHLTAFVLAWS
jgi:hypothetical protein